MCQKAKCINPIQKRPIHINPLFFHRSSNFATTCVLHLIFLLISFVTVLSITALLCPYTIMIIYRAAYTFLLFSCLPGRQIYGALPTTIMTKASKGQETKSIIHHIEQRQLGKKKDDDESTKHEVEGKIDILYEDEDNIEGINEAQAETDWPTYMPTIHQMKIPSVEPVPFNLPTQIDQITLPVLNCNPIGSRTNPVPRPTRNLPVTRSPTSSPEPPSPTKSTADNTPNPTKQEVTFRRGDMSKDIKRFGINGMLT